MKPLDSRLIALRCGLEGPRGDVQALARIFNHADPHVRRAFFHWVCGFVGLPDFIETPARLFLMKQAKRELRQGLKSGRLKIVRRGELEFVVLRETKVPTGAIPTRRQRVLLPMARRSRRAFNRKER